MRLAWAVVAVLAVLARLGHVTMSDVELAFVFVFALGGTALVPSWPNWPSSKPPAA
jgi:hypothetical protein